MPDRIEEANIEEGHTVKNEDGHVSQRVRRDPILVAKTLLLVNHVHCINKKAVLQRQLTEPNKTEQNNLPRSTTHPQRIPQLQRRSLQVGKPQNNKPLTVGAFDLVFSHFISRS